MIGEILGVLLGVGVVLLIVEGPDWFTKWF